MKSMDLLTIEECINMWNKKKRYVVLNDGKVRGIKKQHRKNKYLENKKSI